MPSFDALNGVKVVASVGAEALSADKNGDSVDGKGFHAVLHVVEIGVGGITFTTTNKIELRLQDSADGTTYADVTNSDDVNINTPSSVGIVQNPDATGIFAVIDSAAKDDMSYAIGYRGLKQFSRVIVDFSGTHATATPLSASALLSRPDHAPVI